MTTDEDDFPSDFDQALAQATEEDLASGLLGESDSQAVSDLSAEPDSLDQQIDEPQATQQAYQAPPQKTEQNPTQAIENHTTTEPETSEQQDHKQQLPPYNLEIERSALGALLFNSNPDQRDEFFAALHEHDFFKHSHQIIFVVLRELHQRVEAIDLTTLSEELRAKGLLQNVGGLSYIASLTLNIPSSINLPFYAQKIRSYSIRRQVLTLAQDLTHQIYKYDLQTEDILADAEQRVLNLAEQGSSMQNFLDSKTLVQQTFNLINERRKNQKQFTGIESGFPELDRMTLGFQKSELIIIGARPSVGKTALALSMLLHIAGLKRIPVGMFSLEMNGVSLMERLLSAQTQINSHHLRSGLLGNKEMSVIAEQVDYLYKAPLYIDDSPSILLLDLRTRARRMVHRHGVQIIFIDYLGLISVKNTTQPRHEQMAEISMHVKALARELQVPVVALSQVGRQTEGKVPGLSDLRGSGSLEQDADVVMYLHRNRASGIQEGEETAADFRTDLVVAKQRNGPVGTVELLFIPKFARFVSATDADINF